MKSSRILAIASLALLAWGCFDSPGPPRTEPDPTEIDQVSQLVTAAEGGEVRVGQSAVLTIAPGALAQDTVITVDVSDPLDTPADSVVKGKVYDFGPDGLQFSEPAILELETEANAFSGPGSISKFAPNLGLWDEGGPTASAMAPNLGLWDQVGHSGSDDFAPNLGLWDGDPEKMATAVTGFSKFATTLPGQGVYSCGVDDAGSPCCWGQRVTGCSDCLPAGDPLPTSSDFVDVAPGAWSDCGVRQNGTVVCWGSNPPVPPAEAGFVQVAVGRGHACALKDDGTARCFMAEDMNYDVPSPSETNIVALTAGDFHACALEDDGSVFCWGPGRDGETDAPTGTGYVQIDAGSRHTCAVTGGGDIDCWGSDISGLLRVPSDETFVQVSVGVFAACALTELNEVICWGADHDVVVGTPTGSDFTRVTARYRHACAARQDGSVVCWGEDIEDVLSPPSECRLPVQQASVECDAGYRPTMAGCVDIDECEDMTASCDANATCTNLPGTFECACDAGFVGDGFTCSDVDECADGTDNCGNNATCTNNAGGFDCACDAGYMGDGVTCTDVDECVAGTDNCDANATCTNNVGGFDCACDAGYTGDGVTCADVDECTDGTDNCGANATCTNVPGSFDCMCDAGYAGDGVTCTDVDECTDGTDNCDANAVCTNNTGGFDCMCNGGYTGDGVSCMDIDECALAMDNCDANATCSNLPGTFDCMCDAGYAGDGVTCTDVDECGIGADNCDSNATCTNTTGSFTCMCNSGFAGDGVTCVPLSNASHIAAGAAHTCAIRSGEVYCWGDNMLGQLGDGTNVPSPMPVQVGVASDWVEIAAGPDHTCAVSAGGELWCWGSNFAGQLGDGTMTDAPAPVRESTNATNWATVTAGGAHTCAMTDTGSVFCWGDNLSGQIGDGTTNPRLDPTQESTGVSWTVVKAGGDHTCAIDGLGNLSCWGANFAGQLGNGMPGDSLSPFQIGGSWDSVSLGGAHTCATTLGQLHCWGSNISGQLGVGGTIDRNTPARVGADTDWAAPSAGGDHTCGLKDDGSLWCWGYNIEGQLGIGDTSDRDLPVRVGVDNDWTDVEIPVIGAQTCGLKGGGIECWGANFAGQLGIPSSRNAPAGDIDPGSNWTSVSAVGGQDVPFMLGLSTYGCGIKDGAPWCWGTAAYHQSSSDHTREVAGTMGDTNWSAVSSGTTHACGLQLGAPRCWGDNADGGLGDGTNMSSDSPVVVQGTTTDTDWTMVSAGSGFSCGIKSGGLWCWGRGVDGQLGDNQTMSRNTPVESGMNTGTMWSTVSAGHIHACGIHAGDLYCWGDNPLGQLGNGTVNPAPQIPTLPTNMGTSFSVVAAGDEHTCAIDVSGNLLCTGDNTFGELGDGSTVPSLDFIPIGSAQAPWGDVAVGRDHTCGIAGGILYCWGANQLGQLGDATFNDASTPVAVSTTFSDWVEVTAGDVFSCARRSGGQVHCWGDNNAGQMGDDSLRFLTPRPVALP